MRSKQCEDGKRRILAKVEVPVDADAILTYALAHPSLEGDDAMNHFENANKRQLFQMAKETIRLYGVEKPADRVSVRWTERQIERARIHVRRLFPEVD
jgi:hypothetical protein